MRGAKFWPDVHRRILTGLIISQLLLIGLLSTKGAAKSTRVLIVRPILTIWFHYYCRERFESDFLKFPLHDAMLKDTLERATDPTLNLKAYLKDGYVHPVYKCANNLYQLMIEENNPLVATKGSFHRESKAESEVSPEH